MKKYTSSQYLRYGNKNDGDYHAFYFRMKDTKKIQHYMYFNDPADAVCWIFRKSLMIQEHCWSGGCVKNKEGEPVFIITENFDIYRKESIQELHNEYLKKWKGIKK